MNVPIEQSAHAVALSMQAAAARIAKRIVLAFIFAISLNSVNESDCADGRLPDNPYAELVCKTSMGGVTCQGTIGSCFRSRMDCNAYLFLGTWEGSTDSNDRSGELRD